MYVLNNFAKCDECGGFIDHFFCGGLIEIVCVHCSSRIVSIECTFEEYEKIANFINKLMYKVE